VFVERYARNFNRSNLMQPIRNREEFPLPLAGEGWGGGCRERRLLDRYYFTPSNSTSNISVALGGITPPAPRAP
jgi:hypothetical protein